MKYTPDYKYKKAKDLISNLDKNVEDNELILYYIKKKEDHIANLEKNLEEYREWFKKLDSFLPNRNITYK
jgi:predicted RNase H-like nuclease (RuvC/YqgF family)